MSGYTSADIGENLPLTFRHADLVRSPLLPSLLQLIPMSPGASGFLHYPILYYDVQNLLLTGRVYGLAGVPHADSSLQAWYKATGLLRELSIPLKWCLYPRTDTSELFR